MAFLWAWWVEYQPLQSGRRQSGDLRSGACCASNASGGNDSGWSGHWGFVEVGESFACCAEGDDGLQLELGVQLVGLAGEE